MLKPIHIEARDLPDAWFQCVYQILEPGNSRKRQIGQGSYAGEFRLEFDYITGHVLRPSDRPLVPDIPPQYCIPNPTDMDYVEPYFERYLMSSRKAPEEQYTYGERICAAQTQAIAHVSRDHTFLGEGTDLPAVNQIEVAIDRYKKFGPGNNQLILQVGQPADLMLKDPPCLRHIDTRIEEKKLHFMVYFRSWDLWGGFPANLAAIQLLKEYMASEIGVGDGELIFASKGLHLYGYTWEIAGIRRGLTQEEMRKLKER